MATVRRILLVILDFIQTIVVTACIFVVIYVFLLQPHQVIGNSMLPNFHDKEYILTDKISYCLRTPQRGEIVVFRSPDDPDKDFIKRVIGLPHEKVKIQGGVIYVNEVGLKEEYVDKDLKTTSGKFLKENEEIELADNTYLVLGDNRFNSSDSRSWGPIMGGRTCGFRGSSSIIGRTLLVYWPPQNFRLVKTPDYR